MNNNLIHHPIASVLSYVILIFSVVIGVKAYLGFLTVQNTITFNMEKNKQLQEQITYLREFRLQYLQSEYAEYFTSHENAIAHVNEQIIKIVKSSEQVKSDNTIISPSGEVKRLEVLGKGRKGYIIYKIQKITFP